MKRRTVDRLPTEQRVRMSLAQGWVYFVEAVGANRIKIGFTRLSVEKRLAQISKGSPFPVQLLFARAGSLLDEAYEHELFARERVHREWFEASPRLRAHIAHLIFVRTAHEEAS